MKLLMVFIILTASLNLKAQTATAPVGEGTTGNPYQIASLENLYWIAVNPSEWTKEYKQTADIDASTTNTWDAGAGWTTIGNDVKSFAGWYDGNGYTISGLYINRPGTFYQGLFGKLDLAVIDAVRLVDVDITGGSVTGALAGAANASDIRKCSSTGTVTGGSNTGGLVGYISSGYYFQYNYSTCDVTGTSYAGGLVGYVSNFDSNTYISDCYAQGSVTVTNITNGNVGGLVGYLNAQNCTRCYSTGRVMGVTPRGGFAGDMVGTTSSNNFWDTQTSTMGSSHAATGKTTAEMKDVLTYSANTWDIGSSLTWGINATENDGYPFLTYQGYTSYDVASVTTQAVTAIVGLTATANGTVTQVGTPVNSQHGHCWATTTNPTIADFKTELGSKSEAGIFTSSITNLLPGITYYVKSYITNSLGTFYGGQATFTSGKKTLYITGEFTANDKKYIGATGTVANINVNNLTLSGVVAPYTGVSFNSINLRFEDGNAGDNKRVYIFSVTITGPDASKYTVSATGAPETTASITKKALLVTSAVATNKVYDGTTDATISGATLNGLVGGDAVSIGASTGTFDTKNVGTTIHVTSTLTLTGVGAENYTITHPTTLKANITAKQLTVSGTFTADDKTVDGNNSAIINQNNLTLSGVEDEDVVTLTNVTAQFNDATIGNSKPVSITNATLDGADKDNYTLTLTGAPTTTANIVAVKYAVNVSQTGNGTTTPATGSQSYNQGTTVSLTATPDGGWVFEKWIVNGVDSYISNIDLSMDKEYNVKAVFSVPTSITTVEDIIIEAFPNPTSRLVNIKSNKKIDHITVSSISGQMIESNLIQNELSGVIDLGDYPAGIYILKLKSEGDIYFIKILKQ